MLIEGVHINAIYQHIKSGNYYKVINIANDCSDEENGLYIIYHGCNENGIYRSIREYYKGIEQSIVLQPFCRQYYEFIERFKFIKEL